MGALPKTGLIIYGLVKSCPSDLVHIYYSRNQSVNYDGRAIWRWECFTREGIKARS